ncbi:CST complex subunit STN1 isoform X3 [Bos indicus x Bos taurus]|uniref:CST complex subunit STN1 isoform X3 n=1 Tax=Bos indicus x Bos taurus TaxID=30522 RepID=UPI000F7D399F|nr:CST complex subunit STN1 isoform X3 [Bos indicus x Bos taurus]XP_059737825.1 CST complex subunit STN1 isoform X3 [Bos taurus]
MQNGARPRWEGAEPRTARRKGLGGDTVISALDAELFRADWKPQPSLQMESNSSQCEDETPSLLWGLDPVFLAFAKLYIRDILDLKESGQVQGVFFYNGHPIKQVDILGTVIGVREKDAFYSYGATATPSARELSLTSQLKKLQETIAQRAKLEIGDIIRVRGHIRMFRGEREIHATTYYKVDDPVCNVQIARMLELPAIYRKVYDQPFHSPALKEDEALSSNPGTLDLDSLTCLLSEKAKEFLVENRVQSFYQQELETVESLLSLANQPVIHSACSGQMGFKNDTTSRAIHSIFRNAVKLLQEEGLVFQKDGGFDNLFYVTREDKELHRKIHRIIQEECQKPNRFLQERMLEWVAMPSSRDHLNPGIKPRFPALQVDSLPAELPEKSNYCLCSSVGMSMSSPLVSHCQPTKCPRLSSRQPSSPGNHHDPFKRQILKLSLSPKGNVHYRIF